MSGDTPPPLKIGASRALFQYRGGLITEWLSPRSGRQLFWIIYEEGEVKLLARAATAITKKVLTSFDVTKPGGADDIKEICNLLLRSCLS